MAEYKAKESFKSLENKHFGIHKIKVLESGGSIEITNIDEKCVIPLLSKNDIDNWTPCNVYGVCSDYIELLK